LFRYLNKELYSNKELSDAEVCLYGRLAETMAQQVKDHLTCEPGFVTRSQQEVPLPPAYFDDLFMSDLEVYSGSLSQLGILEPLTNEPMECIYVLSIPPEFAYAHAVAHVLDGPSLYQLLVSFICYSTTFGGGFRTGKGESFPVCVAFDVLFQALVKAEFAERRGREYRWTEKIAPAMKALSEWEVDDDQ